MKINIELLERTKEILVEGGSKEDAINFVDDAIKVAKT